MRWSFVPIVAIVSLGVASGSSTLSESQIKNVRQIAVISMLGDTFHGVHIGQLPAAREGYAANVVDWRLDDDITEYLRGQLAANGFAAVRLDLSPKATEDFYSKPLVSNHYIYIEGYASPEPNYKELCQLALAQSDDMLVVAGRTYNRNSTALPPGYGFVDGHVFGFAHRNVYGLFVMRAFDTHSCSQRALAITTATDRKSESTLPWKDSYEAYSDDERSALKAAIEAHIRNEIDQGLRQMNFVRVASAASSRSLHPGE
jgi:hypothetical protein